MNYFAHGRRFVDEPYFLAGTAVPDWLSVVDRRARVRFKLVEPHCAADDPRVAAVARGILQHLHDDQWFHATRAFAELNSQLSQLVRQAIPGDESLRPGFLGHILVEILLDAALIAEQPMQLQRYYRALEELDAGAVHAAVNRMATRPMENLDLMITRFCSERFLCDYADDGKLCFRLNQVMRRVKLPSLPEDFCSVLPECRRLVAGRRDELLTE